MSAIPPDEPELGDLRPLNEALDGASDNLEMTSLTMTPYSR